MIMKKFTFAGIAGSALAAGFIGLAAPAMAAPSDTAGVNDTVSSLQDQGYTVIVQNPNNVPLYQASVTAVRQGPEQVQRVQDRDDQWVETTTQSIVFVDVK